MLPIFSIRITVSAKHYIIQLGTVTMEGLFFGL